jgi:Zn-dependent peptidase ImmA (M78 family)
VKLRLKWQHKLDVSAVDGVLRTVARQDAELAKKLPRPLRKVISLGCDVSKDLIINVCFEDKAGLTAGHVVETLRGKYKVEHDALPDEKEKLGGYFYGIGTRAFIFYETQHGEGFERFTIAHEAGHLFLEFVPMLASRQQSLFEVSAKPVMFAARDTPGQLLHALDSFHQADASLIAEHRRRKRDLREIKANGFAAELLAPFQAVQKVVDEHPNKDHEHYVALLEQTFKLSRTAARVRLAELAEDAHPDQEILRLLG